MTKEEKDYILKYNHHKKLVILVQLTIIISLIILWELLSQNKIINPFIFSSPSKIIKTIINLYLTNQLFNNIFTTLYEIMISFIIGFIISFIIAILMYSSKTFAEINDPFLTILNSLPKVALGPILIIWFGANTNSIIIMALLINVVVSTLSLYVGFIKVNKYYLLLFKSLHASKKNTIWNLIIPSSFENIISSLKLNISMTLIGVIMGEFLVSKSGIGYLIIYGTQVFNLDLVYTGIFLILIISYLLYKPIVFLEKKYCQKKIKIIS
jgi:NitT/TauT family transport system permease protein